MSRHEPLSSTECSIPRDCGYISDHARPHRRSVHLPYAIHLAAIPCEHKRRPVCGQTHSCYVEIHRIPVMVASLSMRAMHILTAIYLLCRRSCLQA